jgi:hypothetical protein
LGKIIFLVGLLVGGYYIAHKMSSFDPTVFAYSKEQVQAMLADAKTTLPRRDGPGEINIWSAGRSENGVRLNMQYASWAPLLKCEAVITEIAPDRTRVVPDCSSRPKSDSALSNTQDELLVPMFEEHIQATLNKRAFNRDIPDRKEAAIVFKNLGGMQNEALRTADEIGRLEAESRR